MLDRAESPSKKEARQDSNRGAGIVVFFTGLSGAGKTTIANLLTKSLEDNGRSVTQLDGDVIRKCISSELGFSKEHRDLNIRRIGFVASEIAKHGGIAICAAIAPYDQVRREVRGMAEANGRFVLVHVSTPLDVCERRDAKGLYARARSGLIPHFTGISDPYEEPRDAEIVIDTITTMPEEAVRRILSYVTSATLREENLQNTRASVGALPHRGDSRR